MAESRIDELRRRLERDPGSRSFAQLAEELRKAGDPAEAVRVARAGLQAHPVYASARLTLGRALLETGDAAGARLELEQALRQAPDNILASRFLAQALQQLGERASALRQFEATLAMSPGDAQLAAQVKELAAQLSAAPGSVPEAPAAAAKRALPPPLPTTAVVRLPGPSGGQPPAPMEPPAPTIRMAGGPPIPGAAPAPAPPAPAPAAPPLPSTPRAPDASESRRAVPPSDAEEKGGVTLPPLRPERVAAHEADEGDRSDRPVDEDERKTSEGLPFSSSTLAELYLRQGLPEKALEVYRQVLAEDPGNERARARLTALQAEPARPGAAALGGSGLRRQVLERQIAGLEGMLASVRRR